MSQTTEVHTTPNSRILVSASNLAVPVTNSLTTLLEIASLNNVHRLWMDFAVTVHDLNAFAIQGKFHPSGSYRTLANAAAQFTSPTGVIFGASKDMTTCAAASNGWVCVDTTGLTSLRVQASSASASGTLVDIYAGASS